MFTAGNEPVNYIDNLGLYAETIWDIINVSSGASSTINSIKKGNYSNAVISGIANSPMQERFGKAPGTIVYSLSYILMPIGLLAVLLYLTIKGISFFGLL